MTDETSTTSTSPSASSQVTTPASDAPATASSSAPAKSTKPRSRSRSRPKEGTETTPADGTPIAVVEAPAVFDLVGADGRRIARSWSRDACKELQHRITTTTGEKTQIVPASPFLGEEPSE